MNINNGKCDHLSSHKMVNRVALGSLLGFMGLGISFLRQVLLVPLFLLGWGASLYGEWMTLYALVGYLTLTDIGMNMYVINRLNHCYSTGQLDEYRRILHSSLLLFSAIVAAVYCLFVLSILTLPVNNWLNIKIMGKSTLVLAAVILGGRVLFAIPMGVITGLYQTFGEFPRGVIIRNLQQFGTVTLICLILLFGGGVVEIAGAELITFLGFTLLIIYDIKKRHPDIDIGFQASDLRLAMTFLGPGLLFFLIKLSNGLTIQGSVLVVSVFAGGASVAVFVVHRTLLNLMRQFVGFFCSALWPELTSLEALGKYDKLRVVHRLTVKLMFLSTVFISIWLHFAGKDIIELWTLNKITFHQILFDTFLLYLIVQTPYSTSGTFLAAINRHKSVCICSILSSAMGIGLAIVLVRYMGMVGVVAGLLIGDALLSSWFIPLNTCRIIGENFSNLWKGTLVRGFPIISAGIGVGWFVSKLTNLHVILNILITGLAILSSGVILGWFFWLNRQERNELLSIKQRLGLKWRG